MIKKPRIIEKVCLCGCGNKFFQSRYNKGYIKGHSQKITTLIQMRIKHPAWRGGVIKKRGYVFIHSPNHPNNDHRYVKRSRLVMEKKIGRYLYTREHVHHINGIKDDDRIENLALLSISEHKSLHNRIPKGKWSWKYEKCLDCSTNVEKHYAHGLCHKCYSIRYYKHVPFS